MDYSFDIEMAKKYGQEEAVIIKNFQFWISKNKADGRHLHEDRTWTYNSVKAFCILFPFWTAKQIRRILKSLSDQNVTIEGNYNEMTSDRKIWYAFKDESIFLNELFHLPKREHPFAQTGTPLADSKPDNKPDNNILAESFEEFYQQYPRKVTKQAALKSWTKLHPDSELISVIMSSLARQKESEQWVKDSGKFIPYPATWLNGRRWEDEAHQEKKWNEA